jgi:hypothetical protein
MSKKRRTNPRLRRAWNKRSKYMPSFTNMKEYTNMQVTVGANVEELQRGEPVVHHDSLLMLKRLGGFYQGIDKFHKAQMPWLSDTDIMVFSGSMYLFFRTVNKVVLRTQIYPSKEHAERVYRQGKCHWFIPYKERENGN